MSALVFSTTCVVTVLMSVLTVTTTAAAAAAKATTEVPSSAASSSSAGDYEAATLVTLPDPEDQVLSETSSILSTAATDGSAVPPAGLQTSTSSVYADELETSGSGDGGGGGCCKKLECTVSRARDARWEFFLIRNCSDFAGEGRLGRDTTLFCACFRS